MTTAVRGSGPPRSGMPWSYIAGGLRDLVTRREVLLAFVERQARLKRKRAVLGLIWPMFAPLFLLALYTFVFRRVFDVPIQRYPEYLFAGLLPWTFLVQTTHNALQSVTNESDLVRRAPFPHEHLPLAMVLTNLGPFAVLLVGFIVFLAVTGGLDYTLLPVLLFPIGALVLFTSALAMTLAAIDVFNRDLRLVLGNLLTVWFFLVPIVYRPSMAGPTLLQLRSIDPMNMIVGQFRYVLVYGDVLRPVHVVLMLVVCTAVFLVALGGFRWAMRDVAKEV